MSETFSRSGGRAAEAGRSLARRAGATSLGVAVSRVTGLVREQILAALFPTAALDAFVAAFTLPSTLREMLAEGALSKAFLTVFAQTEERAGQAEADRLLDLTIRALLPVLLLTTIAGIVFAPQLVSLFFTGAAMAAPPPPGFDMGFRTVGELSIWLTRIMFPFLFFISLAALFLGALQARRRFFLPAAASAFFNVTTAVSALLGALVASESGFHPMSGLALGVPLGGLAQFLIQWRAFRRLGRASRSAVSPDPRRATGMLRDPGLRKVGKLFFPVALAAGGLQIHVLISRHFASMGASWLAWMHQGYRLIQLPAALFGVALSHAGLPALSRARERGDEDLFLAILIRSGRMLMILSIASAAGIAAIAEPLVAVIYQHGAFRAEDAAAVATVIRVYALGLPAFGATRILSDAFFALGSTRAPLLVTMAGAGLIWFATDFAVVGLGLGYSGIPLATAFVAWVSVALLFGLLAPRLGSGGASRLAKEVGSAAIRGGFAGGCVGGAAWLVAGNVDTEGELLRELLATGLSTLAGVAVFALAARRVAPVEFSLLRDAARGLFGRGRK